jgi:uncharacterized protein
MENVEEISHKNGTILNETANPAPLALCGFGITTILLSLHNSGLISLSSTIISMALIYGGLAQVIGGLMEWKKNNTFGLLIFGSYGFFWISYALLQMLPAVNLAKPPGSGDIAAFLFVWAIFTIGILICSLKISRILQFAVLLLLIVIILLIIGEITAIGTFVFLAGVVGIILGLLVVVMGFGQVINEQYGRKVIPV